MILGFIGTGKYASCVITGISKSKISYKKIYISSQEIKRILKKLRKKYNKIFIVKNNQEIINKC
jgi:pyrroline-5-carboxylate reductase